MNAMENRASAVSQQARRIARAISQIRDRRVRLENTLHNTMEQSLAANDHSATHMSAHPRLSLSLESDGEESYTDLSALALAQWNADREERVNEETFEDETMSQGEYEAEDTSVEDQVVEQAVENGDTEEEEEEEEVPLVDPATLGLKEISNLGKFTVSSHKQGNGVDELRSDDLKLYWQYVVMCPATY